MKKILMRLKGELSGRELSNEANSKLNCEFKPELRSIKQYDKIMLELLGNKYIDEILSLTSEKNCCAMELSHELEIPLATVYRKLKLLEEKHMIEVSKTVINISGNEEKYYRCLIDDVTVNFHGGKITVDIKKLEPTKKIIKLWERFTKPECLQNNKAIAD